MTRATGMTFVTEARTEDDEPLQVTGEYVTRYVDCLDYTQHTIGGIPVDPATVVLLDPDEEA